VCVKPAFVDIAARELEGTDIGVGTVVNFPHGNSTPSVIALEAYEAIGAGANELDVVINIGAALTGQWNLVRDGLEAAISIGHEWGALVKIILETCYFSDSAIRKISKLCADAGADFVKTSTGYGPFGATAVAVKLMTVAVNGRCQVKASGGIASYEDAELYLDLGCTRLGSSKVEELFPYDVV
jgi:deoxyribose-phosphate aldolase